MSVVSQTVTAEGGSPSVVSRPLFGRGVVGGPKHGARYTGTRSVE